MGNGFKDKDGKFHPTENDSKKLSSHQVENAKQSSVNHNDVNKIKENKSHKAEYISSDSETIHNKTTRNMMESIAEGEGIKPQWKHLEIAPSTFLKATNNDANYIPVNQGITNSKKFADVESVKKLKDRMENHKPIDVPLLAVDEPNKEILAHEGRHRAYVAKQLGIKKIPTDVMAVTYKRWNGRTKKSEITESKILDMMPQQASTKERDNDLKMQIKMSKQDEVIRDAMKKVF